MYQNRRLYEKFISPREVIAIHEYTVRVLEEVGVSFPVPEVLDLFRKHGATVEGDVVKISEKLLNEALATVPSTFSITTSTDCIWIGERYRPQRSGPLGPPGVLDEGIYREALMGDVVKQLKIQHGSDAVDFVTNGAYDTRDLDKSKDNFYLPQVALCLKYTDKPTYGNVINNLNVRNQPLKEGAKEIAQLYKKFYDVWDRPVLLTNCCAVPPLAFSADVLENILGLAEEGQPVVIVNAALTNVSAPASLMGTLIVDNATILAGVVLTQLINPGVPVVYGNVSRPSAMKEMSMAHGAPEGQLIDMASIALARYYGLPVRTATGLCDALEVDYQAGVEYTLALSVGYVGKADFMINTIGHIQNGLYGSYQKMILDEEVNRMWMRINEGIDITEAKGEQAFEWIAKAGPGGTYLFGKTPKEYRQEHYLTKLFNRKTTDVNELLDNGESLLEKTQRIIDKRLEEYELPKLDKAQKKLLNQYLPESEKYKEV